MNSWVCVQGDKPLSGVFAACVESTHLPDLRPGSFALSPPVPWGCSSCNKGCTAPKVLRCTKQLKKTSFCDVKSCSYGNRQFSESSRSKERPEEKVVLKQPGWTPWRKVMLGLQREAAEQCPCQEMGQGWPRWDFWKTKIKMTDWFEPSFKVPALLSLFSSSAVTPWRAPRPPAPWETPFSDGICLQGHSLNHTSDEGASTSRTVTKWDSFPS